MKIVTVNVPESYIDAINTLIGENGLYPSRSELIRAAVRKFLLKELQMAKTMVNYKPEVKDEFDDENFVRIPVSNTNEDNEPVREFKDYKVLNRLEATEPTPKKYTSKQFKHAQPSKLIRYTKDFPVDLTLSHIKDNPGITDKDLETLTGYQYQTVRNNVLKAIKTYKIPVIVKTIDIPHSNGKIKNYTLNK